MPLYEGGTMEGPLCAECGHLLNTEGRCLLGHAQSRWFKVSFGLATAENFPTDPLAFWRWLMSDAEKSIQGLSVVPE